MRMDTKIDTIIVGAGQAGLSLSYYLKQAGREHLVLEKAAQPVDAWRNQRWDSFTLVTPNWSFLVPGAEYSGPEPGGYLSKNEIVAHFDRYVERNHFPVRCEVTVSAVEAGDNGSFTVRANGDTWQANRVVIATGSNSRSKIPPFATAIGAGIRQLESWQYRNPGALAPGAVLVVGSGQSGTQIAQDLRLSGRKVYLSIGSTPMAPRRYRGRDLFDWLVLIGFFDRTAAMLPSPEMRYFSPPMISGRDGGQTLNLHRFYREGVTLAGHLRGIEEGCLLFAPDLKECLGKSEQMGANMLKMIDGFIQKSSAGAPPAEVGESSRDAFAAPEVLSLDVKETGITTIIWAAGYRFDFSLVKFPVFDSAGFPITRGGVSPVPGLYFVGMPWMDQFKTAFLVGVGDNARHVAEDILK